MKTTETNPERAMCDGLGAIRLTTHAREGLEHGVGSHGHSGLAAAVMGSVVQAVIVHSPPPRAGRPSALAVTTL